MSLRRATLLMVGIPAALIALTAAKSPADTPLYVAMPFSTDNCSECHGCSINKIYFTNGGNDVAGELQGTGCWSNDCDDLIPCHPALASVETEREFLEALHGALLANVPERVAAVVRQYADWIEFNPDRGALQMRGCSGEITAHLPLDEPIIAALEAE